MGLYDIENCNNSEEKYPFEPNDSQDVKYKYDTAIVLLQGGIVPGYEGSKIPYLPRMRMYTAIDIYDKEINEGKTPVIILSGGVPSPTEDDYTEASFMKHLLVTYYNVPEEDIIVEEQSHTTSTNAKYVGEILAEYGFREQGTVKLVTNDFHLSRSKMLFDKYYGGSFEAIGAEEYLFHLPEDHKLRGDKESHPYALFARKFKDSLKNKKLFFIDSIILKTMLKFPLGEWFLDRMAWRSRIKNEKEKVNR